MAAATLCSRIKPNQEATGLARQQVSEPLAYCRRTPRNMRVRANEDSRRASREKKDEQRGGRARTRAEGRAGEG